MRSRMLGVMAFALTCGLSGAVVAQPLFSSMALMDETAPGAQDAATFLSFADQVAVNEHGWVSFNGTLQGVGVNGTNNKGYWIGDEPGFAFKLIRAGEDAPGTAGVFDPTFAVTPEPQGDGASILTAVGGVPALYFGDPFGLALISMVGDTAPARGLPPPLLTSILTAPLVNDNGSIALHGEREGLDAVWRLDPADPSRGGATLVLIQGDPAPDLPGLTIASITGVQMNNAGQMGLRVTLAGAGVSAANNEAFYFGSAGSLQLVVREGTPAANVPGQNYGTFGATAISDTGVVAFTTAVGANTGLWSGTVGSITLVALKGQAAPGGGTWDTFGPPLLADNVLAFTAQTRDGFRTDRGVYRKVGANATVKILKTRDSAAFALGAGSTIDSVDEHMALSGAGQVLFRAAAVGGQAGTPAKPALWSADENNQPFLILRVGQQVTVLLNDQRTVSGIQLALNSSGQDGRARRISRDGIMGVSVTFANGTAGVLKVFANGNCPGDANGDDTVNFSDLNAVLVNFGMSGPGLEGDVNGDELVNFTDLNLVLGSFGAVCRDFTD